MSQVWPKLLNPPDPVTDSDAQRLLARWVMLAAKHPTGETGHLARLTLQIMGFVFDPGLPGHTGFWYDPWDWVGEKWPSVQMQEKGLKQPESPFALIQGTPVNQV